MDVDTDTDYVQIIFELEQDEYGYPPSTSERLWATRNKDGFVLDNIPFFATGVSWGDTVRAEWIDREYLFREVLKFAGHGTIRILVTDKGSVDKLRKEIYGFGCDSEQSHIPGLIAVDVPPDTDIEGLLIFLNAGEKKMNSNMKREHSGGNTNYRK